MNSIICDTEFEGRRYAQQLGLKNDEFTIVLATAPTVEPLERFALDISRGEQSPAVIEAIRLARQQATYYVAMFRAEA